MMAAELAAWRGSAEGARWAAKRGGAAGGPDQGGVTKLRCASTTWRWSAATPAAARPRRWGRCPGSLRRLCLTAQLMRQRGCTDSLKML